MHHPHLLSLPPGQHPDLLIACEHCDALHVRAALQAGERAICLRCGAQLYRDSTRAHRRLLPLVVTAVILMLISNMFPIVAMDLKGTRMETTLWGAIQVLYADDMTAVALLVFATTLLLPLGELLMMGFLLVPMAQRRMPRTFHHIARAILLIRPWGMIEVFMIGVLVTLVKLSTVAQVLPGVALWSFGALVAVLAAILSFPPRDLWRHLDADITHDVPAASRNRVMSAQRLHFPTATAQGLLACHACDLPSPMVLEGTRCPRCGATLHHRKPASMARAGAFLLSAYLLYIPANLLPIMVTQSIFGTQHDTILSGVIYLWLSGSHMLSLIVLIASVIVPLLKMMILTLLLLTVRLRSTWRLREQTRLYAVVELIGRWSMLDVFVVALLASLVRAGSLATITPGAGALAFAAVVVLTMLASLSFDPRLLWDNLNASPQPIDLSQAEHARTH